MVGGGFPPYFLVVAPKYGCEGARPGSFLIAIGAPAGCKPCSNAFAFSGGIFHWLFHCICDLHLVVVGVRIICLCWHRCMLIISLARFSESDHQDGCILFSTVGWFEIQTVLLSALDPRESRRFLHSCLWLYSDRSDLLLSATEFRLQLNLSTFSMPTPAVQAFLPALPIAVGQGGGVWDEVESDHSQSLPESSENSTENHAVEEQNTH